MNEDEWNDFDSDACDKLPYEGDCSYIPLVFQHIVLFLRHEQQLYRVNPFLHSGRPNKDKSLVYLPSMLQAYPSPNPIEEWKKGKKKGNENVRNKNISNGNFNAIKKNF